MFYLYTNSPCDFFILVFISFYHWCSLSDSARSEPRSDPGKGVLAGYVPLSLCPALFRECTGTILLKFFYVMCY